MSQCVQPVFYSLFLRVFFIFISFFVCVCVCGRCNCSASPQPDYVAGLIHKSMCEDEGHLIWCVFGDEACSQMVKLITFCTYKWFVLRGSCVGRAGVKIMKIILCMLPWSQLLEVVLATLAGSTIFSLSLSLYVRDGSQKNTKLK